MINSQNDQHLSQEPYYICKGLSSENNKQVIRASFHGPYINVRVMHAIELQALIHSNRNRKHQHLNVIFVYSICYIFNLLYYS